MEKMKNEVETQRLPQH